MKLDELDARAIRTALFNDGYVLPAPARNVPTLTYPRVSQCAGAGHLFRRPHYRSGSSLHTQGRKSDGDPQHTHGTRESCKKSGE